MYQVIGNTAIFVARRDSHIFTVGVPHLPHLEKPTPGQTQTQGPDGALVTGAHDLASQWARTRREWGRTTGDLHKVNR